MPLVEERLASIEAGLKSLEHTIDRVISTWLSAFKDLDARVDDQDKQVQDIRIGMAANNVWKWIATVVGGLLLGALAHSLI